MCIWSSQHDSKNAENGNRSVIARSVSDVAIRSLRIPAPVIADNEEAPSEDDVEFVLDDDISEEELEAAV